MAVMCNICEKVFSTQSNLNQHRYRVHKIKENISISYDFNMFGSKCLEGCNVSFKFISNLRLHLESVHNMDMMSETLHFRCMEGMYNH